MLYFSTITWAPSIAIFLIAQVLRVIDIGFIDYQGISYIQVLMPDRVASAATLFSNTANAGSLFAGIAAGGWAMNNRCLTCPTSSSRAQWQAIDAVALCRCALTNS